MRLQKNWKSDLSNELIPGRHVIGGEHGVCEHTTVRTPYLGVDLEIATEPWMSTENYLHRARSLSLFLLSEYVPSPSTATV